MGVHDIFSKRQRVLRGEIGEVYKYDEIPIKLANQICRIISNAIGEDRYRDGGEDKAYRAIHDALCDEHGHLTLAVRNYSNSHRDDVFKYFMSLISEDVEEALDVIEFTFRYIVEELPDSNQRNRSFSLTPSEAVDELNTRFREHSVGFQFVGSQIISMSSDFLHTEVIKPVLLLLNDSDFEGAHEEFHKAHRHYREGLYKECLTECLKSFESTIKSIATLKGWSFDPKSAAKGLVQICVDNQLLPPYIVDTQITHFRLLLESVAIPRNKNAAHGQGPEVVEAPEYIARYGLNLTGTSILLLIDAHKAKH